MRKELEGQERIRENEIRERDWRLVENWAEKKGEEKEKE
jgi:hypothetical protein